MRHAISVTPAGQWSPQKTVATVTLSYNERYRRRFRMTDDAGVDFLLNLNEATLLMDGDGLILDTGGYIAVRAANELIADLYGKTPAETARIAWHIGNRHTPVQVLHTGALRIVQDHVLINMVEKLGAKVIRHQAPFVPEAGAYGGGQAGNAHNHTHGHKHGSADEHHHAHKH